MASELDRIEEAYKQKVTRTKTWSGFDLKEVYTPDDVVLDYQKDLPNPGEYPFTRGIHPDMYRGKLWTMRHESGYGLPQHSNKRLKFLAEQGASGLDFIVDNPTHLGMDADHPLAQDDVGKTGVPLSSLQDMEELMEGIPIEKVSMFTNCFSACAFVILAQYVALAQNRGIDISCLRGQITGDSLHSRYCGYRPAAPIDQALRVGTDLMEYCTRNMPLWNLVFPGYNLREGGINAVQEIAFIFALALAFSRELLKRGLSIDDFAPRISFVPSCHVDFFEEIAKIRAARRLWAKIMKEWLGAKDPRSCWYRGAAKAAGCSLVPQQPLNNIVRTSIEALAAVLAGVQALEVTAYDEPICIPTDQAHRTSLRIQQIIAHETGAASVADPLGGSYYIEHLTNKLEEEITSLLLKIENMGGIVEAMKTGWLDQEIDQALFQYEDEVESKKRIIVGMNEFIIPPEEDVSIAALNIPPELGAIQAEKVKRLKKERDNNKVREALKKLKERTMLGENVMPYVVEATKAYATIGEIVGTIRQAYGYDYDPAGVISSPFSF